MRRQVGEDYALVAVPPPKRDKGVAFLASVVLAIPTALVFFATGMALGTRYGFVNLLVAVVLVSVLVSFFGVLLSAYSAHSGLDSDLLSIPAGFGKRGSAVTSLIYSMNFIVLYAIESQIILQSVQSVFPWMSPFVVIAAVSLVLVAATWFGISIVSAVMSMTLPIFVISLLILIWQLSSENAHSAIVEARGLGAFGVLACAGVLMVFIVNATVAADVGRFLSPERRGLGVLLLGVLPQVLSLGGSVMLGAWFGIAFGYSSPGLLFVEMLGLWGLLAVLVSQSRINIVNLYSGSLSLSNYGVRGLGIRPGRHLWLVVSAFLGASLALFMNGPDFLGILAFESAFTCSWVGVLAAVIVRRKLLTTTIELEDCAVFDWLGIRALSLALAASVPLSLGFFGPTGTASAPFVALIIAVMSVVATRDDKWVCSQ